MRIASCYDDVYCLGDEKFSVMKKAGFDYADYFLTGELEGKSEEEALRAVEREKRLADEAGVTIRQTHGPWIFPPRDNTEARRNARAEIMKRSLRHCAALGCKYWVIHPVFPFGCVDIGHEEESKEINLRFFRTLLPYAKKLGITICFENMPFLKHSFATPEKTLEFIREINDENFKFCLDTGHCAVFGISPAEAARAAGKDLAVIHVHDNDGTSDNHDVPFSGVIDWADFYAALNEIGFDGIFSLEASVKKFLPNAPLAFRLRLLKEIGEKIVEKQK